MRQLLAIFAAITLLTACDDDKQSATMPVFAGFKAEWTGGGQQPTVGDTIILTAVQSRKGDLIYDAKYEWRVVSTLNGETKEWTTSKNVVYDNDRSDPVLRYRVPEGTLGTVTFHFAATYQFSADLGDLGSSVAVTGYIGLITTHASSLMGAASGTCSLTIAP